MTILVISTRIASLAITTNTIVAHAIMVIDITLMGTGITIMGTDITIMGTDTSRIDPNNLKEER